MRVSRSLSIACSLLAVALPVAIAAQQAAWRTELATLADGGATAADALRLTRGIAYLPQTLFRDGTVEFDLAPPTRGLFVGVAFRMQTTADYDIVYFRAADAGRWADLQYQGVWEGETSWQLYPGPGFLAAIPPRAAGPMHVRLVMSGDRADVYLDGAADPVLRVPRLQRTPLAGGVGFWTVSPGNPQGVAEISGIRITPGRTHLAAVDAAPAPAGQLVRWRVSDRLPSPDSVAPPAELTAALTSGSGSWRRVQVERSGLVNLTRAIGNAAGPQASNVFGGAGWGMALARTALVSDRERTVRLRLGFSDGAGVYLNGRRVFAGDHRYERTPGYLGALDPDGEVVELPLRPGRNELVVAVTDRAFGWGFAARLEDAAGVRER